MLEVLFDVLLDSLLALLFVFVFNFVISFFESKIAHLIEKKGRAAPILGSLFGTIPQCGVSIVAADLYSKRHITVGTLVAIFLACSDEALPIVFSKVDSWYMGFALIGMKLVTGIVVGYIVDLIFKKVKDEVEEHHNHCEGETEVHVGCCNHEIEENESPLHSHLVHPLIHSLKIFAYIFVINLVFGLIIYFVGSDVISSFLNTNIYLTPLFSWLVGLIPNCASSVILAEAYVNGSIPFSALLCGLSVNAGLGMIVLFKSKKDRKITLIILAILSVVSLALGYGFLFI